MRHQPLFVIPTDRSTIDGLYDELEFPEPPPGRPYVAMNMVSTIDGKVTIGGRSFPVGSAVDHGLMRKIRAAVDMVIVGAGTLRNEDVNFSLPAALQERRLLRGLGPHPLAAVISASAELPLQRKFFQSADFESIVFTSERADRARIRALESYARVIVVGQKDVDLNRLMSILVDDLGVKRLLVEGGPTLNFSFVDAGYADELFWTVAPKIVGGRELTMVEGKGLDPGRVAKLKLLSAFAYNEELYLRYRFVSTKIREPQRTQRAQRKV
ncbi:MAG: dihydrofolate reductase family protein [Chloroflexi bacterium]|nr:dihydrofolate reductase family protein [Chloroflexota bacterium]